MLSGGSKADVPFDFDGFTGSLRIWGDSKLPYFFGVMCPSEWGGWICHGEIYFTATGRFRIHKPLDGSPVLEHLEHFSNLIMVWWG